MAVQADTSTARRVLATFLASAIERAFSHAAAKLSTHAGWPALLLDSHPLICADFVCVDLGQFRLAKKPGQRANVQLVFVMFALTAVLGAAIGEHTQQRDLVLFEEGQHAVVQDNASERASQ
jgi:hypothetical protein